MATCMKCGNPATRFFREAVFDGLCHSGVPKDEIRNLKFAPGPTIFELCDEHAREHKRAKRAHLESELDRDDSEHIEQFFKYAHLPEPLRLVSAPFGELAKSIIATLPRNPERTVALRKLLEAKDAAVRAAIAK